MSSTAFNIHQFNYGDPAIQSGAVIPQSCMTILTGRRLDILGLGQGPTPLIALQDLPETDHITVSENRQDRMSDGHSVCRLELVAGTWHKALWLSPDDDVMHTFLARYEGPVILMQLASYETALRWLVGPVPAEAKGFETYRILSALASSNCDFIAPLTHDTQVLNWLASARLNGQAAPLPGLSSGARCAHWLKGAS